MKSWRYFCYLVLLFIVTVSLAGAQDGVRKMEILDKGDYIAADGQVFQYEKFESDGEPMVVFKKGKKTLTLEQMRAYEQKQQSGVLSKNLKKKLEGMKNSEELDIIIKLKNQPAYKIANKVNSRYEKETRDRAMDLMNIHRSVRPPQSLPPDMEKRFLATVKEEQNLYSSSQRDMIKIIQEQMDLTATEKNAEIKREIEEAIRDDQMEMAVHIELEGGKIHGTIVSMNAISARVKAESVRRLMHNKLVGNIFFIPKEEIELNVSVPSLWTQTFWNNSIDGGIWDAGVLDTGVQQNHPAFGSINFLSTAGTVDTHPIGHGTHVAGIIASGNNTYKGPAFGLDKMLVGFAYSANVLSHADWMVGTAADDPEVINLSFGYGRANDVDYSLFDAFWDGLIDNYRVLVTKSAGNGGSGANTISHPAPAYNLLAVANMNDMNTTSRGDDVIRFDSSRGPTLNNRKKPDITAPGTDIMSTHDDWATAADYVSLTGTSMAAPHVAGGTLLVVDLRSSDDPKASKAVLINTADAWNDNGTLNTTADDGQISGSQWNRTYGWGYMDLWEAWYNGTDVFTGSVNNSTKYRFYKGQMYTNEKATLVWNRHVNYNGAAFPSIIENLTDLDLRAYRESNGAYLAGSLTFDENVEQIAVSSSQPTVLKVKLFSIDPDVGTESFSLSTEENFSYATPPALSVSITAPGSLALGQMAIISATVTNSGNLSALNTNINLSLSGLALISGPFNQNVGTIAGNGGVDTVFWIVQSLTFFGFDTVTVQASSNSYGESFNASATRFIF